MQLKPIFLLYIFLCFLIIWGCGSSKPVVSKPVIDKLEPLKKDSVKIDVVEKDAPEDSFFLSLLRQYPVQFSAILANKKNNHVQIIYTQIDRDEANHPHFTRHSFNSADKNAYFYPASTVKFPVALLALQKLEAEKNKGIHKNTSMITGMADAVQTAVYNDPNTAQGKPTIAQYIKKILLVSDNDAYNRLYEYLGQEAINTSLHAMGFKETQILHRLELSLSDKENRTTNPIDFYNDAGYLIYSQPAAYNQKQYTKRSDFLGKAYYSKGKLINTPMDFSLKNKLPLEDLHKMITDVIFPDNVPVKERFNISEEDRNFVLKYMSSFPAESVYPNYDEEYYDAYVKFLLYGSENRAMPKNIRIFNKVGNAYGQLTDAAYIVDFERNIEFILSATINCNTNQILNDDTYDYYKIGYPFMRDLGKLIYQYELKRGRYFKPDLSAFKFTYDK